MNNFLPYSIKVWLFTAIAGPIFSTAYFFSQTYINHNIVNLLFKILFTMLFAFGCSVPFCAVFAGINKYLFKMQQNIKITKAIANVVGLLLGILPLTLIKKHMNFFYLDTYDLVLIYAACFTIAIWSFRIVQEVVVEKPKFREDVLDDDFNFGE